MTRHASQRLMERGLIMDDVLHVLQNGFVHEDPELAQPEGFYRYRMTSQTPNSMGRDVCVVVIPDGRAGGSLKIVTVMWVDES